MKEILIKNQKNRVNAQEVLTDNGFEIVSSWSSNNIFKKNGEYYKISHSVWTRDLKSVRIVKT